MGVVRDLNQSGASADDEINNALQCYKKMHKPKGVNYNNSFKVLHC
ncbi:hypothetical protein Pcac1_g17346 [Phytophthora cactorum]|nr:hypothetical protein Pcac1_g17346 [Phytophthora cactorum]KAG3149172.1 hypothetical protein C6341_g17130 [Phytophthora cactorum]